MRNYEKLITVFFIQLICQPRLFAADRQEQIYWSEWMGTKGDIQGKVVFGCL